jgi:glucose-6-phosphate 1-dehydrogenase
MALAPPAAQAIVVFGASGDLAHRKILPALYCLLADGLLPEKHTIIGCSSRDWDDDAFRAEARTAVEAHDHAAMDGETWKSFADSLSWLRGTFEDPDTYRRLAERLDAADREHGCAGGRFYYLAVPPDSFATIVKGLASVGANTPGSRLVVEKPFGTSLESARELTTTIHESFDESQLFRIDHYLGKETVQNLVVVRFGNSLFERMWNRDVVDNVQLTVAEDIGTEGRASYYERAGAIRDLLQNHMLQVLAFLTMEPPRTLEPEAFRDEQAKLLRTIRVLDPSDIVRGQYEGYRAEEGVDPSSQTETYIATRLWIDNWRWEDVPFFLRHGKKLPERNTEISVVFRKAPDYLFREMGIEDLPADHLTIRIQPNEGMSLAFQAKNPGPGYALQTVGMDFSYDRSFDHAPAEAYERLLHDAMDGDHTLFPREDAVDRAWEIVTPILDADTPLYLYEPGTWGPAEADELIAPRRWHLRPGKRPS